MVLYSKRNVFPDTKKEQDTIKMWPWVKSSTQIARSTEVGGTTSQLFTSCLAVSSTKQVKKSKRSVDKYTENFPSNPRGQDYRATTAPLSKERNKQVIFHQGVSYLILKKKITTKKVSTCNCEGKAAFGWASGLCCTLQTLTIKMHPI